MGTEKLTAVQTIAEEFTEVDTKTNELLETYNIQQSDISGFDVEPFGQNKFLITILYMYGYVEELWSRAGEGFIALKASISRNPAFNRTKEAIKVGLTVASIVTNYGYTRTKSVLLGLKSSISTLTVIFRAFDAISVGLSVILENYETIGLAARKVIIEFVTSITRGLFESGRTLDVLTIGLASAQFEAWYNGLAIEE